MSASFFSLHPPPHSSFSVLILCTFSQMVTLFFRSLPIPILFSFHLWNTKTTLLPPPPQCGSSATRHSSLICLVYPSQTSWGRSFTASSTCLLHCVNHLYFLQFSTDLLPSLHWLIFTELTRLFPEFPSLLEKTKNKKSKQFYKESLIDVEYVGKKKKNYSRQGKQKHLSFKEFCLPVSIWQSNSNICINRIEPATVYKKITFE